MNFTKPLVGSAPFVPVLIAGTICVRYLIDCGTYSVEIKSREEIGWCVAFLENGIGRLCGCCGKGKRNDGELHFQGEAM